VERVFIVHGWGSNPTLNWFPRIKAELERMGFEVHAPRMPWPYWPDRKGWVKRLADAVGTPNERTHFIGHSLGCTTILLYLQSTKQKVGSVIFVAPWIDNRKKSWMQRMLLGTWKTTRILFANVKRNVQDFSTILSDDDPYVPISIAQLCRKHFGDQLVIEHGKRHFDSMEKKNVPASLVRAMHVLQQKMMHRKMGGMYTK
jgi:predicted alpha/beta hydrolase family esterase